LGKFKFYGILKILPHKSQTYISYSYGKTTHILYYGDGTATQRK